VDHAVSNHQLNYATPEAVARTWLISIGGLFSLLAILAQFPWYVVLAIYAWHSGVLEENLSRGRIVLWCIAAFLPTINSVIRGIISVRKSGTGWRNFCGVMGLVFVVLEMAALLYFRPWQ